MRKPYFSYLKRKYLKPYGWIFVSIILCVISVYGLFQLLVTFREAKLVPSIDSINVPAVLEERLLSLLDDAPKVESVHTLNDKDLIAPRPNPDCYGNATDPRQMNGVLNRAQAQFDMEQMLFTTNTIIKPNTDIVYYLDDSIYAVTWKQVFDDSTYTFSEIRIRHPSQIRRFFSGGTFGSGVLLTTTEMAETVNAVVASSGDYYAYRTIGIVVNNGEVHRHMGHLLDTCFIDENGDLLFTYAGEITDKERAQAYVNNHKIRFTLSFGPLMIKNGEYIVPNSYNSGEINDKYARSAICQMGPLHYVLVTANMEVPNHAVPTVAQFAKNLYELGIPTAYALDGGQTAAIAMNGQLINTVSYGSQRDISDIIYFATAIPEE